MGYDDREIARFTASAADHDASCRISKWVDRGQRADQLVDERLALIKVERLIAKRGPRQEGRQGSSAIYFISRNATT